MDFTKMACGTRHKAQGGRARVYYIGSKWSSPVSVNAERTLLLKSQLHHLHLPAIFPTQLHVRDKPFSMVSSIEGVLGGVLNPRQC